ncbi:MAG: MBOAT family protein [Coriobacteriia bacterium]|nr:MBOAT family protein [Coriobacteriia bacterium]
MEFLHSLTGTMSFTSATYLSFLTLAVLIYFTLPGPKTRSLWLLCLSSFFYLLFSPAWFWVLLSVTVLAYVCGLGLSATSGIENPRKQLLVKRSVLWFGVLTSVSALLWFKYIGFFAQVANKLLSVAGAGATLPVLKLVMPLGISFWTFQVVAYVVDVYKERTPAVRNPLYFATSVIFFPIVAMGPISRVQTLIPQLSKKYTFDYDNMRSSLLLIGWGFFKKLMIADRLAVFVNTVFDHPHAYSGRVNGLMFFVAAVFFAIQLYTDFSGYTDIVRGSARLFGVELPLNFRAPYFARSVADFWRRWHMTLMDWLKTYIYIPLGGNRKGKARKYLNLMAVFFVSGFWHGVGMHYIVWGLLNGSYQILGGWLKPFNDWTVKTLHVNRDSFAHKLFQTVLTFVLITVAWVFFRANSIADALYILPRMFMPTVWIFTNGSMISQGLGYSELVVALISSVLVWVIDYLKTERSVNITAWLFTKRLLFRWTVYYGLILVVLIFGHYGGTYNAANFVYFKF